MNTEHDAVHLRRYACLAARHAAHVAKVPLPEVVLVAERFAAGIASIEELRAAHADAKPRATGAGVVGLPRCAPAAAACLSALHTTDEDADTSAYWAAEFAVKAAVFREAQIRSAGWQCAGRRGGAMARHVARGGVAESPSTPAARHRGLRTRNSARPGEMR